MKRITIIAILVAIMSLGACATTSTTAPPAGCESSYIYANKVTFDLVMSIAVMGVQVMATTNPAYYKLAHESALTAAAILKRQPISLSGLGGNVIVNIMSPLLGLIPMDQVLGQCDRDYLAAYLLMI